MNGEMVTTPDGVQMAASSARVLECVRELTAGGELATRAAIVALSGLRKSIVDDRLRSLVDAEMLLRSQSGIYELVRPYPMSRAMSKTILGDGFVKVEIGDHVLDLTPTEDRHLAMLQSGAAAAAQTAGGFATLRAMLAEVMMQLAVVSRDVRRLRENAIRMNKVNHALCLEQGELPLEDVNHGNKGKERNGKAGANKGGSAG